MSKRKGKNRVPPSVAELRQRPDRLWDVGIEQTWWAHDALNAVLKARRARGESDKLQGLSKEAAEKLAAEINAEAAKRVPETKKKRKKNGHS